MERSTPEPAPNGSAQPRTPQPTARDRLASLQGDPPRYWSPAAEGPLPLSEALAARRHANRPWWRRAAQSIEEGIPLTLRGRWTLSLPAATAVALVAITAAGVGGWYLTRSQGTVVDVGGVGGAGGGGGGGGGGGNAGEAAATSDHDDHTTASPDSSARALGAGSDAACRSPRAGDGTSAAPTRWGARTMRVVPVAWGDAADAGLVADAALKRLAAERAGKVGAADVSVNVAISRLVAVGAGGATAEDSGAARPMPADAALERLAAERASNLVSAGGSPRAAMGQLTGERVIGSAPDVARAYAASWRQAGPSDAASARTASARIASAHAASARTASARAASAHAASAHTAHPIPPATAALARWHHAPITRRYAHAMASHRSCPPRTAVATSPTTNSATSPALGSAVAGAGQVGAVVVDVEGKVAHPGVQTLSAGSRVYEALAAAGGALPGTDVTALDLARPVTDGEQLRVGIAGAPGPVVGLPQPTGGAGRGKRGKTAQPVNLNTATLEQLETVPDVGPALAQRILDWRTEHGRFASVAQLREVRGIGERKFADMQDSVTV